MCLSIADRVLNQSDIESVWVLTLYSLYPDIASVVNVCWDRGLQRLDVHLVVGSHVVGMEREGRLLNFCHIDKLQVFRK